VIPGSDLEITWHGADGSTWPLLDITAPVQLSKQSLAGLHMPAVTQQWTAAAHIAGRRRSGIVRDGRELELTVHVGDLNTPVRLGQDWRDLDARWWSSLSDEVPGRLVVSSSSGSRSLQLWLQEAPDPAYLTDPAIRGTQRYSLVLAAEDAYWSGSEITVPFEYAISDDQDYYGGRDGSGAGPDFFISGGSQFSNATVTNPGEIPAYPRYLITAPFASAVVGPGNDVVTLPFQQVNSQRVLIDTDPRVLSIVDGQGNDLWPLVGSGIDPIFAPIPPKATVPMTIELTGAETGSGVYVSLTPQFRRAW
jgi:hypothetical protein